MAVERNPFDRIEEDNIIEIGISPESTEIEAGPVNMEFADDGGVVIETTSTSSLLITFSQSVLDETLSFLAMAFVFSI